MKRYHFLHLTWLLPAYFLLMHLHQWSILGGIDRTFEEGQSYVADVLDFDVKQIAAQTSGYVVLSFDTAGGETVTEQLSLSVQMAQVIMDSERIPVRYLESSQRPIVIVSTYSLQRTVVRVNLAVTFMGLAATLLLALYASRFAMRRIRRGDTVLQILRSDLNESDHTNGRGGASQPGGLQAGSPQGTGR